MTDIESLVALAEAKGVDPYDLDVAVHEAKAAEAAEINNSGLEAQIEYLVASCSQAEVRRLIEERSQ